MNNAWALPSGSADANGVRIPDVNYRYSHHNT